MRLMPLLLLALALAVSGAHAQDSNATAGDGNATAGDGANTTDGGDGATEGGDAGEAAPQPTSFTLLGKGGGGRFWFEGTDGLTGRNPTIYVPAGETITITLRTESGGSHNVHVDGQPASEYAAEGEEITYTFTAPAEGQVQYWCDPHKGAGMAGTIRVGAPPAQGGGSSGGGGEDEVSGPTVRLRDVGFPECPENAVAPAQVAEGTAGNPTLADYVAKKCGGDSETQTETVDPYAWADSILPITFVLIALGAVGMVWVHKYYKP